tara:strand:+ start:580 stop:717 length:138 start_codon:yes stop_codon:yes gene_type:complete
MKAKQKRILKISDNAIQGRENGIAVESFCSTPRFVIQIFLKENNE